jgi:hypothetical protein
MGEGFAKNVPLFSLKRNIGNRRKVYECGKYEIAEITTRGRKPRLGRNYPGSTAPASLDIAVILSLHKIAVLPKNLPFSFEPRGAQSSQVMKPLEINVWRLKGITPKSDMQI